MNHATLKHPGRWIWLLLLVPVCVGLARLHFDVEIFDLLPKNLPVVEGLKSYQHHFTNARELIVTVQSPNAEQTENAARVIAENLRKQTNLISSATWEPPWNENPGQLSELMAYIWFNQPPEIFQNLANRFAKTNLTTVLNETREKLTTSLSPDEIARLSYDPFGLTQLPGNVAGAAPSFGRGQGNFSSGDGTFRIIFVQARDELRSYRDCENWLAQIKPIIQSSITSTNISVGYTGRPAFVSEVAAGMKHDMIISVGGTSAVIALLFWLAHRRVKPMLWLLLLLALILGSTLALGGLIFGTINVVSIGFAAILLGLAVDYAVVHYQEALAHPHLSISQIRHSIAPSIFWAAVTTITAFLVLNFGGLPGLGQLGTLVGLGVALAACVMIFEYLPPLFPDRKEPKPDSEIEFSQAPVAPPNPFRVKFIFSISAAILLACCGIILMLGAPRVDSTANALRPRGSPAYEALDKIQKELGQQHEILWLIVSGKTVNDVAQHLDQVQSVLNSAVSNKVISGFTLPTALWPRPEFQSQNRSIARELAAEKNDVRAAALTNGFAPNAVALTEKVFETWQRAASEKNIFWPTNPLSQWIFNKVTAQTPTNFYALGLINAAPDAQKISALASQLPRENVLLSSWELLGSAIFSRVKSNMWKVIAPMIFLVLLSLWLAFRRPTEILLGLAVLILSGFCLLAVMRLVGWSWNLLDLMAIPLILGTGVDYSIFMQLALRRYNGNLPLAYFAVGRALLLCGGTAIAAFTALAFSLNAGMASLGEICAVGIACNMLIAIFLLPIWWHKTAGKKIKKI